jgi:CBS domain-containing protein
MSASDWIGLGLIAVGGGLMLMWWRIRQQQTGARRWPSTVGVVTGGDVRTLISVQAYVLSQGGLHPRAEPRIEYEYQVNGQVYHSDKVRLGTWSLSVRDAAQVIKDHAPGTPVTVYYDPTGPHRAVLDRTGGGEWGGVLVGLLGAAAGVVFLLAD